MLPNPLEPCLQKYDGIIKCILRSCLLLEAWCLCSSAELLFLMQHSKILKSRGKWPELFFLYWTGVVQAPRSWSHLAATLSLTDIHAEVLLAPCWWMGCLGMETWYSLQIPSLEWRRKLLTFFMSFSNKMKTFDLVFSQNDKKTPNLFIYISHFWGEGSIQLKTGVFQPWGKLPSYCLSFFIGTNRHIVKMWASFSFFANTIK